MKNFILLIMVVFGFSRIAKADIVIKKFDILKTQDGRVQVCKESADSYRPGTYTIHSLNHRLVDNNSIATDVLVLGRICKKYPIGNSDENFYYIWRELNLFEDYNYPVMKYVDTSVKEEYFTVATKDQQLVVTTRDYEVLFETELEKQFTGAGKAHFEIDITRGILPQNMDQFHRGEIVSSVFYVYVKGHKTLTNSWDNEIEEFIDHGPAYSFVYFIQKN